MWGLYHRISELEAEVKDLKQRLKNALAVNEKRLDEIRDLNDEIEAAAERLAGEDW